MFKIYVWPYILTYLFHFINYTLLILHYPYFELCALVEQTNFIENIYLLIVCNQNGIRPI